MTRFMHPAILATAVAIVLPTSAAARAQPPADAEQLMARAQELSAKSEYGQALALLNDLARSRNLPPDRRARVDHAIGMARFQLGEFDAALRAADAAEQAARALDAPGLRALVAALRGLVQRGRGHTLDAIRHHRESLEFAQRAGDRSLIASAYTNLSSAHQELGDWSRVLYYADRAFDANPGPSDAGRVRYLIQRGIGLFEFHDRDRAEASFSEALALARKIGDRRNMCLALGELGLIYWEFDRDRTKALRVYDEALELARQFQIPELEAAWLLNSGTVFRDANDLAAADRRYARALRLVERADLRRIRDTLLKNMGQVRARLGQRTEAERFLLEAMREADRSNRPRQRWESRLELARLYHDTDPARADRYFAETLEVLEAQHSNVLLENFRAGAYSRALLLYNPYDDYIEFLLGRGETRTALFVAERARARAFLDTLTSAREQLAASVPPLFLEAEHDLLQGISQRQARLRTDRLDAGARQTLLTEIQRVEEELTRLRLRLTTERPALAQARYPHMWTAEELQRQILGPDEAMLLFFLGRRASTCWIIRRDGLDTVQLPARAQIEAAVRAYLEVLRRPSERDARAAAGPVSRMLLATITGHLREGMHVIVVPHGILHYLPFEALTTEQGRYLIERVVISYAPSASSFAFLKRQPAPTAEGLVAIGDPLTKPARPASERSIELGWVGLLKPLPHSGEEVRRIASVFGRRARVLERDQATEANVQAGLADAAVVHFATHGLIDEDRPERSGLALTATPPADDGLLQVREVYRLKLRAALVTLSACQTALGKDVTGEGLVGLSRAFFYAGANAVLASLWNVNDASTAEWMTRFYEKLSEGRSIDEAARAAKLDFLRGDTTLRHPYYWAPFVVSGHAGARLPARHLLPSTRAAVGVGVAALALAAGYVSLRAARRRRSGAPTR